MRDGHPVFDSGRRRPVESPTSSVVRGSLAALLIVVAIGGLVALLVIGSLDTAGAWSALIEDRDYLERLGFSLAQAAGAAAIGLAVGLPASWFLSRGSLPLRGLLGVLVAAPLAIPGVVLALGIDLIADGQIVPRALVILAHSIFATAVVTWLVTPAWAAGDPRAAEDARLLGARPFRAYLVGTGRHLPSAVRLSAALAFWYAFAAAGTVAVLGGAEAATTESTLAFGDGITGARPATGGAFGAEQSAVALVQVLVGILVFTLGGLRCPRASAMRPHAGSAVVVLGVLYLLGVIAVLWAPLGWVVSEAVAEGGFDGLASASVGGRDVTTLAAWTGILAALSALAATSIAWLGASFFSRPTETARGTIGRWLLALPAALTGAAIGWGGLLLAEHLGADLNRTYAFTIGAHALIAYPFALRILGVRRDVSTALTEDALLLGATERGTRWRWCGRQMLMALASAFLVAVVLSAGEVAAAHLLNPTDATPAALGLLRGWAAGSEAPGTVYALGAALAGATVIAFAGAEWLRRAAARVEAG